MPISEEQRAWAVGRLKEGHAPEAVHAELASQGIPNDEVYAFVSELVRLKHEAEARDPTRLREEATWMLIRGASVNDVVQRFAAAGIEEPYARPEAERLLAIVRTMKPCERCGAPVAPKDVMFDIAGRAICVRCFNGDNLRAQQYRGAASEFESIGVLSPLAGAVLSEIARTELDARLAREARQASGAGLCTRCGAAAVVATAALPPHHPANASGARFGCSACGAAF